MPSETASNEAVAETDEFIDIEGIAAEMPEAALLLGKEEKATETEKAGERDEKAKATDSKSEKTPPESEADVEEEEEENAEEDGEEEAEREENSEEDESEETEEQEEKEKDADEEAEALEGATKKKLLKRIDKLTARMKSAEEKAEKLQQQLETKQDGNRKPAVNGAVQPTTPLGDVWSMNGLNERAQKARELKKWARQHINEGVTITDKEGNEKFLEPEQVQKYLEHAEEILDSVPDRKEFLQAKAHWDEEAQKVYPDLFKRDSETYQWALQTVSSLPGLLERPDFKIIVGDYLRGYHARLTAQKKSGADEAGERKVKKEKKTPPLAPRTPESSKSVKVASQAKKAGEIRESVVASGGTQESLENYFESAG